MDKFGIFNLLNSFFSSNAKNSTQGKDQNTDSNPDILSAIKNILSPNNAQTSAPQNNSPLKKESPSPKQQSELPKPLQASMLSTMRSHDEFVKRVLSKKT